MGPFSSADARWGFSSIFDAGDFQIADSHFSSFHLPGFIIFDMLMLMMMIDLVSLRC